MPTLKLRLSRKRQVYNAEAALGDAPIQAGIYAVWLTWIAIGVIVVTLLSVFTVFSGDKAMTAALARADHSSTNPASEQARLAIVKEGQALFTANCQLCHQSGGYQATGIGPRLDRSANSKDMSYIFRIVRWGFNPMPAFSTTTLDDQKLYKITVYLEFIHANPQSALPK
ncbi:MAG: cytochrome c [Chloroflexota bacterium]|nr:cytochrome c [Chloroflexota bacterium]